mmetsp:Transcript_4009/g.9656  ORF Transcript_4009/g.9656 Transcript_4009/m.9656 type:complete len:337 (+) Transcript_4009:339-1349(+)
MLLSETLAASSALVGAVLSITRWNRCIVDVASRMWYRSSSVVSVMSARANDDSSSRSLSPSFQPIGPSGPITSWNVPGPPGAKRWMRSKASLTAAASSTFPSLISFALRLSTSSIAFNVLLSRSGIPDTSSRSLKSCTFAMGYGSVRSISTMLKRCTPTHLHSALLLSSSTESSLLSLGSSAIPHFTSSSRAIVPIGITLPSVPMLQYPTSGNCSASMLRTVSTVSPITRMFDLHSGNKTPPASMGIGSRGILFTGIGLGPGMSTGTSSWALSCNGWCRRALHLDFDRGKKEGEVPNGCAVQTARDWTQGLVEGGRGAHAKAAVQMAPTAPDIPDF